MDKEQLQEKLTEIFEQKFKENFKSEFKNTSGFKKVNVCYLHDFFEAGCEARQQEIDRLKSELFGDRNHVSINKLIEWTGRERLEKILLNAPDNTATCYFMTTEIYFRNRDVMMGHRKIIGGITYPYRYEYWDQEAKTWREAFAATIHDFNCAYSFKELQFAIAAAQETSHA